MNQTSETTEATETVTGETWVSADGMGEGTREEREAFARGFAEVLREGYARLGWEIEVRIGAGETRAFSARDQEHERTMRSLENRAFDLYCGESGDVDATLAAMERAKLIPAE